MKKMLMVLVCGLMAGCDYTVPLVTTPKIAIDKSVLGLWQKPKEDGQAEQLLVLPLDESEYLVSYPSGSKEAMFARACICRVAGITFIQLKWFGTAEAAIPDDNRVYQFATYSVAADKVTVRLLNSEIVKKETASTDDLVKSITANKDNPKLFTEELVFTKVKK